MAHVGTIELLIVFVVAIGFLVITILPFWMIFKKAGFSPWLALTQLLPIVNLVALFYLAFAEWPVHRDLRR